MGSVIVEIVIARLVGMAINASFSVILFYGKVSEDVYF